MMKKFIRLFLMWIGTIQSHNKESKVLYYHDVYSIRSYKSLDSEVLMGTSIEMFKKHLDIIKKEGYKIVSNIQNKYGEVAIMFDDGFRGIWDNRLFFINNNISPTVFIAPSLIGKEGFLTIDEIKELQNYGFVFECHSWSHVDLTQLTDFDLYKELKDSKDWLTNQLSRDITSLCLPLGRYSSHLIELVKSSGYHDIYSSIPGAYYDMINDSLRRRNLCQFATPLEFKLILRGGYKLFEKRYMNLHFEQ